MTFGSVVDILATEPAWRQHAAAIQADGALQQAVAELLLTRRLFGLAAHVGVAAKVDSLDRMEGLHDYLIRAHIIEHLVPATRRCLRQQDRLVAAVAARARIMQQLPVHCPAGARSWHVTALWGAPVQLAAQLAVLAGWPASCDPASQDFSPFPTCREWHQVVAAVLSALPRLATALLETAGDCSAPGGRDEELWLCLAGCCSNLRVLLAAGIERSDFTAPTDNLAMWVQAAAAGLRLQPLLAQLDPHFRRQPEQPAVEAAQLLSKQLLTVLSLTAQGLAGALQRSAEPASGAAAGSTAGGCLIDGSLAADLALLHSQVCRLVHYMAGGGALLAKVLWSQHLPVVNTIFKAAMLPHLPADG